jgi:hypothetical protein
VLRSKTAPTDALSSHQRSRKRVPEPDRRRALELLAGCQQEGCTEALMLAHGFSIDMMVEPMSRRAVVNLIRIARHGDYAR